MSIFSRGRTSDFVDCGAIDLGLDFGAPGTGTPFPQFQGECVSSGTFGDSLLQLPAQPEWVVLYELTCLFDRFLNYRSSERQALFDHLLLDLLDWLF